MEKIEQRLRNILELVKKLPAITKDEQDLKNETLFLIVDTINMLNNKEE